MSLFIYKLKSIIRQKEIVFWTLLFPIILSVLFSFAFSNISTDLSYNTIKVGILDNDSYQNNIMFKETINNCKYDDETRMFDISLDDLETLDEKLENGLIKGIIKLQDDEIILVLKSSGFEQTVLKTFVDEYIKTEGAIKELMIESMGSANIDEILNALAKEEVKLKEMDGNTKRGNLVMIYYYSLVGMALIYGGFFGNIEATNLQANLSAKGARICVSPTKRSKLLATNLSAAILIHYAEMIILVTFLKIFIHVDFGGNIGFLLIFLLLGSICGVTFGTFLALVCKHLSNSVQIAINICVGILGGFLSGMMYPGIKYYIQTHLPFIAYINPVGVMTDGLYALYYYTNYNRFILECIVLCVMIVVFLGGSILVFRRDQYESI